MKPGGTGIWALVISPRLAPLPPAMGISALPISSNQAIVFAGLLFKALLLGFRGSQLDRQVDVVFLNGGLYHCLALVIRLGERKSRLAHAEAHVIQSIFDWNRIGDDEERVYQWQQVQMYGCRFFHLPPHRQLNHLLNLFSNQVRGHADNAIATHGHDREGIAVVAAPDQEALSRSVDDLSDLFQIAARLFDTDYVLDRAQAADGFRGQVGHRSGRDIVENTRQPGALRDGLEVLIHTLLSRFVVVGNYEKSRINSQPLRLLCHGDALAGAVATGAGDYRSLAANRFSHGGKQLQLLVIGNGRTLAGGAGNHETIATRVDEGPS